MRSIYVKNKKGTSDNDPPKGYPSWLDYWEKQKGGTAKYCRISGCGNPVDVGGHVYIEGEGGKEYILPICHDCNNKPEEARFVAWLGDLVPVT